MYLNLGWGAPVVDWIEPEMRRSNVRRERLDRAADLGREPRVDDLVDMQYLLAVFSGLKVHKGQAAGPDGARPSDVGTQEMARALRKVRAAILDGTWRPGPTRAQKIPKDNGETRTLQIPNVLDRVIFAGLQKLMAPFWEHTFLDGSHGSRPRRSHLTLLADLETAIMEEHLFIVATDDVEKAFDSAHIDTVVAAHELYVSGTTLLTFINTVLRGKNPRRTIGIDQGNAYSPTALNVLMHDAIDKHTAQSPDMQDLLWMRYVDNIVYATKSMTDGRQALQTATRLLNQVHLNLKGEDGDPRDIHKDPVDLLGFTIKTPQDEIVYAPHRKAWEKLDQALMDCHESNNPTDTARNTIRGWLNAMGPAAENLTEADLKRIRDTAESNGHRRLISIESLRKVANRSHSEWRWLQRKRHRERLHLERPRCTLQG